MGSGIEAFDHHRSARSASMRVRRRRSAHLQWQCRGGDWARCAPCGRTRTSKSRSTRRPCPGSDRGARHRTPTAGRSRRSAWYPYRWRRRRGPCRDGSVPGFRWSTRTRVAHWTSDISFEFAAAEYRFDRYATGNIMAFAGQDPDRARIVAVASTAVNLMPPY